MIGAIQDVTEQRAAVEALAHSEARYRRLFQHSLGLICTHSLDGTVTSVNPAASHSLGLSESDVIGRSLAELIPRPSKTRSRLTWIVSRQTSDSGMMELVARDGSRRFWAYHNVLDTEAQPPYVLGHAQDITTQHIQEQQLHDLATRDPLTRAFNRRYLTDLAQQQFEGWGCLVFDLDHFKEVNDTQGHAQGDKVLVDFVAFLSAPLQGEEAVVRLGATSSGVRSRCDIGTIERAGGHLPRAPERHQFAFGCAIGRPLESVADTINRADIKLYDRRRQLRG